MKLSTATILLALLLSASVAQANYTFLSLSGINAEINDYNTLISMPTVSGAPGPWAGSTLSVSLNVSSLDTLFSLNDIYASLVHVDSQTPLNSPYSLFLQGADGFPVVGAGTYTPTVSLGLASTWLVNGSLNGDWGLYVDSTRGGASFTVNNWSLSIIPVPTPEPGQVTAMAVLGLLSLGYRFRDRLPGLKRGSTKND